MTTAEEAWEAFTDGRWTDRDRHLFLCGWEAAVKDAGLSVMVYNGRVIPSRTTDPATSHAAAREIKVKAGSQRALLLEAFYEAPYRRFYDKGMTDEQAMEFAVGVSPNSEYSKRCSELREAGYIEPTGETRTGSSGLQRIVSRITAKGRAAVKGL